MYQRYVTSLGFASERHDNLTSAPSGIRPPAKAPPITDTDTFGAYLTYVNKMKITFCCLHIILFACLHIFSYIGKRTFCTDRQKAKLIFNFQILQSKIEY